MRKMDVGDTSDAITSMQALRLVLTEDLEDIENRIDVLTQSPLFNSDIDMGEMRAYCVARAALYSGLASINEVLGWVRLMAPHDADGDIASVIGKLPPAALFSIH